jgi:hypothetical protein
LFHFYDEANAGRLTSDTFESKMYDAGMSTKDIRRVFNLIEQNETDEGELAQRVDHKYRLITIIDFKIFWAYALGLELKVEKPDSVLQTFINGSDRSILKGISATQGREFDVRDLREAVRQIAIDYTP